MTQRQKGKKEKLVLKTGTASVRGYKKKMVTTDTYVLVIFTFHLRNAVVK
jgi:hypothetical protein